MNAGAGYHLVIVKQEGCDEEEVSRVVQDIVPEARVDQSHGAELSYILPSDQVAFFERLFNHLETHKEELRLSSYGASQTTMEEVFLRLYL